VKTYKTLIYGYGNPGRQDDGLGNCLVDILEDWVKKENLQGFSFDSNYQLNIEDAATVTQNDLVVFVDASVEDIEDVLLTQVNDTSEITYTTHAASPGYIVHLCRDIYKKIPAAYLLHVKGYEWDFREGLSDKAKVNLEKAAQLMKEELRKPENLIRAFKVF
jgi:hydrogenase maturation protease